MKFRNVAIALVAVAALISTAPPTLAKPKPTTGRFSKVPIYTGQAALGTTVALLDAGGGESGFGATKLLGFLAGTKTAAQIAALQQKFGADKVRSFLEVFDFVATDAVIKTTAAKIELPSMPSPPLTSGGKALAANLYMLGVYNKPKGLFDPEYMLDALVGHPIHVAIMDDIEAKYGLAADANYHAVLAQTMRDLKEIYQF
jgi:hypothetical protein